MLRLLVCVVTALATLTIIAAVLLAVWLRERRLRLRQRVWLDRWGDRAWSASVADEAAAWLAERERAAGER